MIDEPKHPQESLLQWYFHSLGPLTILLLLVAMVAAIGLIALLWFRGRGPSVSTAVMLLIPLPLVIGALAFVDGSVLTLVRIADGLKPSQIAEPLAHGTTTALTSSCCFFPVLVFGLVVLLSLGFRNSPPPR